MKTIYDFLQDYSKEQVDYIFNLLPDENKELARFVFGDDLSNLNHSNLAKIYYPYFYNRTIRKMRILLEKQKNGLTFRVYKNKNLYNKFRNYTKDEIDCALEYLNEDELNILNNQSFNDLKYKKIHNKVRGILHERRNAIKNIKVVFIEDKNNFLNQELTINYESANPYLLKELKNILINLKNPKYQDILTIFTFKELIIFFLIQNIDKYTIKDIINLLGIDNQELVNIITTMLKIYNFCQSNSFDIDVDNLKESR